MKKVKRMYRRTWKVAVVFAVLAVLLAAALYGYFFWMYENPEQEPRISETALAAMGALVAVLVIASLEAALQALIRSHHKKRKAAARIAKLSQS